MTTTLPYEPSDLLEASRLLDHLVWSYRRAIDQTPRAFLTAEHICLSDYAARTVGLIRAIMDDDDRRRGVSFHHRLRPSNSAQRAAHAPPPQPQLKAAQPAAPAAPFDAPAPPIGVETDALAECEAAFAEDVRAAFEDECEVPTPSTSLPRRKARP